MAPGSKRLNGGACLRKVTNSTDAVMCEGNCNIWYHFECVGKIKSEYTFNKGEQSNYM